MIWSGIRCFAKKGREGDYKTIDFCVLDSYLFLRKEGGEDAGFNYL